MARSQCPVDRRRFEKQQQEQAREAEEQKRKTREAEEQQRTTNWLVTIDRRIEQYLARWWGNGEDGAWRDTLFEAIGAAMSDYVREKLQKERQSVDERLAALEERLWQVASGPVSYQGEIATHDDEAKRGVMIGAFDEVRTETRTWVVEQIEAERRSFEATLAALEERLKSVPGKLPVAKTWREQSVTYQAEFVSHNGALYQARKDTAQEPGGKDWIVVARRWARWAITNYSRQIRCA